MDYYFSNLDSDLKLTLRIDIEDTLRTHFIKVNKHKDLALLMNNTLNLPIRKGFAIKNSISILNQMDYFIRIIIVKILVVEILIVRIQAIIKIIIARPLAY